MHKLHKLQIATVGMAHGRKSQQQRGISLHSHRKPRSRISRRFRFRLIHGRTLDSGCVHCSMFSTVSRSARIAVLVLVLQYAHSLDQYLAHAFYRGISVVQPSAIPSAIQNAPLVAVATTLELLVRHQYSTTLLLIADSYIAFCVVDCSLFICQSKRRAH